MRRILKLTRNADYPAINRSRIVELAAGICLLAFAGAGEALAQSTVNYPVSATTMTLGEAPVSSGVRNPIVDATFNRGQDRTTVNPASYVTDFSEQCYQEYCQAENCQSDCSPGGNGCNRCDISWYLSFDALMLQRTGDRRFSLTANSSFNDDFKFVFGGRLTVGKMCDCTTAFEMVYTGPFKWRKRLSVTGSDNINSNFLFNRPSSVIQPGNIVVPAALVTFNQDFDSADRHVQTWDADMQSFEINRRLWAWDAVSTLIGFRYLNYEEKYSLAATRSILPTAENPTPATSASYREKIDNDLFGLQIGGDLFYVTSLKTSVSVKGKGGLFANIASRDTRVLVDNIVTRNLGRDKTDIAGLVELGAFGHYQCTPSVRFSGGYELWYLAEVATVPGQRPENFFIPGGSRIRTDEGVLLHGFSLGVQLLY